MPKDSFRIKLAYGRSQMRLLLLKIQSRALGDFTPGGESSSAENIGGMANDGQATDHHPMSWPTGESRVNVGVGSSVIVRI